VVCPSGSFLDLSLRVRGPHLSPLPADETDPRDSRQPAFSFLISAIQSGYKRQPDETYLRRSLPPLEFQYSEPVVSEEVREVDAESLENLPSGLDGARYQWIDLDGEGVSGILTEQGEGWFYKRNLSPASGFAARSVCFGPAESVVKRPSLSTLGGGRSDANDWESFVPFGQWPNLDWQDPNLRFVDLTGDGYADVLISGDEGFRWHSSLAEAGFGLAVTARMAPDEESGPRLARSVTGPIWAMADSAPG
jgi:hypothetical protein